MKYENTTSKVCADGKIPDRGDISYNTGDMYCDGEVCVEWAVVGIFIGDELGSTPLVDISSKEYLNLCTDCHTEYYDEDIDEEIEEDRDKEIVEVIEDGLMKDVESEVMTEVIPYEVMKDVEIGVVKTDGVMTDEEIGGVMS